MVVVYIIVFKFYSETLRVWYIISVRSYIYIQYNVPRNGVNEEKIVL